MLLRISPPDDGEVAAEVERARSGEQRLHLLLTSGFHDVACPVAMSIAARLLRVTPPTAVNAPPTNTSGIAAATTLTVLKALGIPRRREAGRAIELGDAAARPPADAEEVAADVHGLA